jgi:hypothetical protein
MRCVDGYTVEGVLWGRQRTKAHIVLGYIDGGNPTYEDLVRAYQSTSVLVASITTGVDLAAHIIDCEPGDATVAAAIDWAIRKIQRHERPTIYGGADELDAVIRGLEARHYTQGLASYWLARYTQVSPSVPQLRYPRHLPPGRQAWQFADTLATPDHHGFDVSVVKSSWPKSVGLVKHRALFRMA